MSSLLDEGLRHHNAGDIEKAEQCYLGAVAANSRDAQALKLLAVLQAERGQFDEAVSYAEAAANLLPDDGECAHLFGRIRIERGEFKAAVPVLRQATQKASSNPTVWVDFGLCLERTSAWTEAQSAFEKVLKLEPNHRAAIHGLGRVAQARSDLELAEASFKRAADADAKDAEAWVGLARVEQQRENLEAALKYAEQACSIAPDAAPCTAALKEIRGALTDG
jgi:protein O-GlcNAc transferase